SRARHAPRPRHRAAQSRGGVQRSELLEDRDTGTQDAELATQPEEVREESDSGSWADESAPGTSPAELASETPGEPAAQARHDEAHDARHGNEPESHGEMAAAGPEASPPESHATNEPQAEPSASADSAPHSSADLVDHGDADISIGSSTPSVVAEAENGESEY